MHGIHMEIETFLGLTERTDDDENHSFRLHLHDNDTPFRVNQ